MLSSLWGENLLQRHYSLLTMLVNMVPLLGIITIRVFNDRWKCWEINQMEVQMCCPLIGQIGSTNFFLIFSLYWYIWSQAANCKLVCPKLVILPLQFVNAIACHILPIVATPLWPSVRMKLTLPKVGDLESSGTPESLEVNIKGQNTSPWGVLGVIGKVLKCRSR